MQIDFILKQYSQRIYLLLLLRKHGLSAEQINVVFNALVVSRTLYVTYKNSFINSYWCPFALL